jgi:membrane protein YdbS with pleckstrin-like domain
MLDRLQHRLLELLKVPPEPEPPLGDPASVRIFRAAPGFLRYRILGWGWKQAGALVGLLSGFVFLASLEAGARAVETPPAIARWLHLPWLALAESLALAGFFIQLLPTLLLVLLDYRYRWYVVTDRSLRIREGVWKVQEKTITFSNVQNISIRQGPVQRLFGISDLRVQTAGGGGKGEGDGQQQGSTDKLHVGIFRGVANAADIRDAVLARLRRLSTSGLGDPEEPAETAAPLASDPALLEAASELLRETRSLAGALRAG